MAQVKHSASADDIAPRIVGVLVNFRTAIVVDTDNVTLQVGLQVISQTPIGKLCTIEWVM